MSRSNMFLPGELSGTEFLALCERAQRGEIHIERAGVGSKPSLWRVHYRPLGDTPGDRAIAASLQRIHRQQVKKHKPRYAFGRWPSAFRNRKDRQ